MVIGCHIRDFVGKQVFRFPSGLSKLQLKNKIGEGKKVHYPFLMKVNRMPLSSPQKESQVNGSHMGACGHPLRLIALPSLCISVIKCRYCYIPLYKLLFRSSSASFITRISHRILSFPRDRPAKYTCDLWCLVISVISFLSGPRRFRFLSCYVPLY